MLDVTTILSLEGPWKGGGEFSDARGRGHPKYKMATAVCAAQDRKVVRSDRGTFLPQRAGGKVGEMELRSFRPGLCYVNEPKKISVYWPLDGLFTAGWTH